MRRSVDALHLRAVRQLPGRVDRLPRFLLAPGADLIEVLEREADRVHQAMAGGALRERRCCPSAAAAWSASRPSDPLEVDLHARRRLRRRRAQQVLQNPVAADTGDVRVAADVIVSMLPSPSRPRRWLLAASDTGGNSCREYPGCRSARASRSSTKRVVGVQQIE